MKNAFTIDVEDYFQVEGFADVVDRNTWDGFETRVLTISHIVGALGA